MTKDKKELEALAADSSASPQELRGLAASYPSLRPIIAMNPASYPSLLKWLAGLNDPAVNVALEQRRATEEAQLTQTSGPQRVSVLQRGQAAADRADSAPPAPAPSPAVNHQEAVAVGGETPVTAGFVAPSQENYPASGDQDDKKRKTSGYLKAGILALLLIAVGALAIFALSRSGGETSADADKAPAQSAPEQDETAAKDAEGADDTIEEEEAEVEEEPEPRTVVYPAPAQALQLSHIVAPSGNISCLLGADGVTCSINSYSFVDESLANCTNAPATLSAGADGTAVSCSVTPITSPGATTLSYGDYAFNEFGACQSTQYGMICWDMATGNSFAVARDGFLTGTDGLIPVSSLPWAH